MFLSMLCSHFDIGILKFHLDFFGFLTIMIPIVSPQVPEAAPLVLEAALKLLEETPSPLATGSNIKMFDLDEDNKAKTNVVAHGVIVNLARGTLHGGLLRRATHLYACPQLSRERNPCCCTKATTTTTRRWCVWTMR